MPSGKQQNIMKISIVTAVLNREKTIGQAIRSVLDQSYGDIELIVMDGGSTDGTLDIIRAFYDERVRIFSERDNGIYDALNKGISKATGDIVGVVHSDDYLAHDHVIAKVAEAFDAAALDAVYGDLDYVSAENPKKIVRRWRSSQFQPEMLASGWMPPHPSLFLKRDIFDRLGAYDTSYRIAADYDAILRYFSAEQFRARHVSDVFVKMRLGGVSNRSFKHMLLKSKEDLRALRKNGIGGYFALFVKNVSKIRQFYQ
jgi:glycosyltransferase involved in cell wall biosynthesis